MDYLDKLVALSLGGVIGTLGGEVKFADIHGTTDSGD